MATEAVKKRMAALRAIKAKKAKTKKAPIKKTVKKVTAKKKIVKKTIEKFVIKIVALNNKKGFVASSNEGHATSFDTELINAKQFSESAANKIARNLFEKLKRYLKVVEVVAVKKQKAGIEKNPVPASMALKQKEAAYLFEDFTGHKATSYTKHKKNNVDVALEFGKCTGIMYETIRDGKKEYYCHEFKKSARPALAASYDGKQLLLVGGNYNFTNRGIVDN